MSKNENLSAIKVVQDAVDEMKIKRSARSSGPELQVPTYASHSLAIGTYEAVGGTFLTLSYPLKELCQLGKFGVKSVINTFKRNTPSKKEEGDQIISDFIEGSKETLGNFAKSVGVGLLGVGDLLAGGVLMIGSYGPLNLAGAALDSVLSWGHRTTTIHGDTQGEISLIGGLAVLPTRYKLAAVVSTGVHIATGLAIADIAQGGHNITRITQGLLGVLGG